MVLVSGSVLHSARGCVRWRRAYLTFTGSGRDLCRRQRNLSCRADLGRSDRRRTGGADGGAARIPVGRLAPGTQVNSGWSWHLEDLTFAEVTIELCDGRPSDVEHAGVQFGGGRFCPWTATIVRID